MPAAILAVLDPAHANYSDADHWLTIALKIWEFIYQWIKTALHVFSIYEGILSPFTLAVILDGVVEEWVSPNYYLARDSFMAQLGNLEFFGLELVQMNTDIENFILTGISETLNASHNKVSLVWFGIPMAVRVIMSADKIEKAWDKIQTSDLLVWLISDDEGNIAELIGETTIVVADMLQLMILIGLDNYEAGCPNAAAAPASNEWW